MALIFFNMNSTFDTPASAGKWSTAFDEDVPEDAMNDFATANRAKERLTAAGIAWRERYTSRDCERVAADPTSPGGWCLELGCVTSLVIEVEEADLEAAKLVIAGKAPVSTPTLAHPPSIPPAPKAWRNYAGEDGWDSEW